MTSNHARCDVLAGAGDLLADIEDGAPGEPVEASAGG